MGITPPFKIEDLDQIVDPDSVSGSRNDSDQRMNKFPNLVKNPSSGKFSRTPKVDVPRYNGTTPNGFAQKFERYFSFHNFADTNGSDVAAIHFDSKVDHWLLNYHQGKLNMS